MFSTRRPRIPSTACSSSCAMRPAMQPIGKERIIDDIRVPEPGSRRTPSARKGDGEAPYAVNGRSGGFDRFGNMKKQPQGYPKAVFHRRDSGAVRTLDPQLRRLLLYPTELRNRRPGGACPPFRSDKDTNKRAQKQTKFVFCRARVS